MLGSLFLRSSNEDPQEPTVVGEVQGCSFHQGQFTHPLLKFAFDDIEIHSGRNLPAQQTV